MSYCRIVLAVEDWEVPYCERRIKRDAHCLYPSEKLCPAAGSSPFLPPLRLTAIIKPWHAESTLYDSDCKMPQQYSSALQALCTVEASVTLFIQKSDAFSVGMH